MAKGNNGISTHVRRRNRLLKTAVVLLVTYYGFRALLSFIFHTEEKKSERPQRPRNWKNYLSPLRRSHFVKTKRTYEDALNEYLTLVDIKIATVNKDYDGKSPPYSVMATFCEIDWELQRQNPSTVSMFRDLRQQSKECIETQITADLYETVTEARKRDGEKAKAIGTPKGVVFHETRCGSTLSANLLASLSGSTDIPTRVYSESPPPVNALKACRGETQCSSPAQKQLVRDVFYMMGRVPPDENKKGSSPVPRVFYKFQSITSHHIRAFTEAFPEVPWMFLYRDSVEVMMSHWKSEMPQISRKPVCARSYNAPTSLQPAVTQRIVQMRSPTKKIKSLSVHEYCAAHLAGLSLSVLDEHERTGRGRFVNYNQMPDIMWEKILPSEFGVEVSDKIRSGMQKVAAVYSKGRGPSANREWKEDSTHKQTTASKMVTEAAKMYLTDVYNRMEKLSASW